MKASSSLSVIATVSNYIDANMILVWIETYPKCHLSVLWLVNIQNQQNERGVNSEHCRITVGEVENQPHVHSHLFIIC